MDLRLDHPDLPAETARHLDHLTGRIRHSAARYRDAEFRQQLFRLVFVDVHRLSPGSSCPRIFIPLTTSISSWTAAADLSKAAFSSSSISTMRSTPPAPITTGTPT